MSPKQPISLAPCLARATVRRALSVLLAGALSPFLQAQGSPISGELFYTRYCLGENLKTVAFDYDGATLTLGSKRTVASLLGADGVVFAPTGELLVGGQGNTILEVDPMTGFWALAVMPGSIFHLAMDPDGKRVWGMGLPGELVEAPVSPLAAGVDHVLTGDDLAITHLAFVPGGQAFYTASGPSGFGSFGTIDMATFRTSRILSGLPAAHGMVYDPYTGHLVLMGSDHVTQIDPSAPASPVADASFPGLILDQGAVTGRGHLLAADNNGNLLFVDYAATGRIDDAANPVAIPFLDTCLDDVAPLTGLGSSCLRLDFETEDDFTTPLANGQAVASAFGRQVTISGSGANLGATIFDSTPAGPNAFGGDADLLVDSGNLLILQNDQVPAQASPGVFSTPDDDPQGGSLGFDFSTPVTPMSIDLIDIDAGANEASTVELADESGRTRTFFVPENWTGDATKGPASGMRTLDLTALAPQPGYRGVAFAMEDVSFDASSVTRITVTLGSSGAIDNLAWCLVGGAAPAVTTEAPRPTGSSALPGPAKGGRRR